MKATGKHDGHLRHSLHLILFALGALALVVTLNGCIWDDCDCDADIDKLMEERGQPEDMEMSESDPLNTLTVWYWSQGYQKTFQWGDEVASCCETNAETFVPTERPGTLPDENGDNTPPVAQSQTVNTDFETKVTITLKATDADEDELTYDITSQPLNGDLDTDNIDEAQVVYTPKNDFSGNDRFNFTANDGIDDSNIATVTVKVAEAEEEPEEPEAEEAPSLLEETPDVAEQSAIRELESLEEEGEMIEAEGPDGRILVFSDLYRGPDGPVIKFVAFGVDDTPQVDIDTPQGAIEAEVTSIYFMPDYRFSGWVSAPESEILGLWINDQYIPWLPGG